MKIKEMINFSTEKEPEIIIKKSSEAPAVVKENPFYDPEFWGRAYSLDDIYLPDSDEMLSYAVTAHEIGHLVKEGKRNDATLGNFEATRAEEQRAWDLGWEYFKKVLLENIADKLVVENIEKSFNKIKDLMMKITDLSKDIYLEKEVYDKMDDAEREEALKIRRKNFFKSKGEDIMELYEEIKNEKNGIKPDWDNLVKLAKEAIIEIEKVNKK